MNDKDYENVYVIPANYTDSGKLFGGMLSLRNTIEAILLVALLGYLEYALMPVSGTILAVIMAVTLIPVAIIAMMGVNGDSLFTFLSRMAVFLLRRKKLIYGEGEHGQKKD